MRNCDPATTAIVNPVGKPLPFKGNAHDDAPDATTGIAENIGGGDAFSFD